ncbi:PAS domain-containing protein [Sphingomonas cavernae]|uniref:PAS domain-containing protein n=1 Tax=Sphingomonas cavernae TaxID=2320861 RepID=A0A418WKY4_9SPHN|nr:PAS domain-containing protein [Sphingomonas cavernae]RJF90602.1 PAS domain-containing protein [Sphingomonas cavernae]
MAANQDVALSVDKDQALFRSIHETPIPTIITDPRQRDNPIVAVNQAFCQLTGYTSEEVIGRNCRFLSGPETESGALARLREAIHGGFPIVTELINYRADGEPFLNAVMIAPHMDTNGAVRYFIGSQMDVTAGDAHARIARRKCAQERLKALTPRQTQILELIAMGLRSKQIASRLNIAEKTVKLHRSSLLSRLSVQTSADAIRIAVEAELSLR